MRTTGWIDSAEAISLGNIVPAFKPDLTEQVTYQGKLPRSPDPFRAAGAARCAISIAKGMHPRSRAPAAWKCGCRKTSSWLSSEAESWAKRNAQDPLGDACLGKRSPNFRSQSRPHAIWQSVAMEAISGGYLPARRRCVCSP